MRAAVPPLTRRGDAFEALRIGGELFGREGDPFLALDHFRMAAPTFPPHAHAGFSAVTYLLPESPGAMRNRDGRGDDSVIAPGGLHWTAAGSGLVHEEVPSPPGARAEGFQIFIRQPPEQEHAAPAVHRVAPEDVPAIPLGDDRGAVRVVAGRFAGVEAPFAAPSPLQLLDVALAPGGGLRWDNPWADGSVALYLFSGALEVDGADFSAPHLLVFARGTTHLHLAATIGDARFAILSGEPLDAPSVSNGPFVLSSQAALDAAVARYRRGEMGTIAA